MLVGFGVIKQMRERIADLREWLIIGCMGVAFILTLPFIALLIVIVFVIGLVDRNWDERKS